MEIFNRDKKIDVQTLKSRLLARRTTRERFRLPVTAEQAAGILTAAYIAEVERRGRKFVGDADTVRCIRELAAFLTSDSPKFGVMFSGVCGNGKTTMLLALQSAINFLQELRVFSGKRALEIVDAKLLAKDARDDDRFRGWKCRDMLAIDDMGTEQPTVLDFGNVLHPVADLLAHRYSEQLFTAITTNKTPAEIRERYGPRVADRLNEMVVNIVFGDRTYRNEPF